MKKNILSFAFLFVACISIGVFWLPRSRKIPQLSIPEELFSTKSLEVPSPTEEMPLNAPQKKMAPISLRLPKESFYTKVKGEVKEWIEILSKGIPLVSLILAWAVRKKKQSA